MKACNVACCWAAVAGRLLGAAIDRDVGNGGREFRSYVWGGKASPAVGELESARGREPASEGEKRPLTGFNAPGHGCGVFPEAVPISGVNPVFNGGHP